MCPMPGSTPRDAITKDGLVGHVGYEINFNRYFYRYVPPRPLEEIEADIQEIEKDILKRRRCSMHRRERLPDVQSDIPRARFRSRCLHKLIRLGSRAHVRTRRRRGG